MIKKKKNNPALGDVYAILLKDNTWAVGQICHVHEIEGYLSIAVSFYSYRFFSLDELLPKIDGLNLSIPFALFSISNNPFGKNGWKFILNKKCDIRNFDIQGRVTGTWGWVDKKEIDTAWILEMYFGIYPWDSFGDEKYMDKLLIEGQTKPPYAKLKKDFPTQYLKVIGLSL